MCSTTSAMDQRSGPGLKFHWFALRPWVASTTPWRVLSRYLSALSRSAGVSSGVAACASVRQHRQTSKARHNCFISHSPKYLLCFLAYSERIRRPATQRRFGISETQWNEVSLLLLVRCGDLAGVPAQQL